VVIGYYAGSVFQAKKIDTPCHYVGQMNVDPP
jgi:hypothetical protein